MEVPILKSLINDYIKYYLLWHVLLQNKKVGKFQMCTKTATIMFLFSCTAFLIPFQTCELYPLDTIMLKYTSKN